MNFEELETRIKMAELIDRCTHLIDAAIELMHADDKISPKTIDTDFTLAYEVLRKHDTAAGLLFILRDIVDKLDAMT